MFLKFNDFKYTNLSDISEISIEKRGEDYLMYMRRGGNSEVVFSSPDKTKIDLFMTKLIEATQDSIVDVSNIIYEITPPEISELTVTPTEIYQNGIVTIAMNFTGKIKQASDVTLNVDNKMTVKTALALSQDGMSATATYTATTSGQCQVSAKVTRGQVTKQATINIKPLPSMTVENIPATLTVGQQQTLTITLTNATDYEVANDNTEAATYTKNTKVLRAVASNGRPVNLTFTPTKDNVKGTPIKKTININPANPASEVWLGKTI